MNEVLMDAGLLRIVLIIIFALAVAGCAVLYAKVLALRVKARNNPELIEATTKAQQLKSDNDQLRLEVSSLEQKFQDLTKSAQEKELSLTSTAAELNTKAEALQSKIEERELYIRKLTEDHDSALSSLKKSSEEELAKTKAEATATLDKTKAEASAAFDKAKAEAQATLDKTKAEAQDTLDKTKAEAAAAFEKAKAEAAEVLEKTKAEDKKLLEATKAEAAEILEKTKAEAAANDKKLREDHEKAFKKLEDQAKSNLADREATHNKIIAELKKTYEDQQSRETKSSSEIITKLEKENKDLKAKVEELVAELTAKKSEIASLASEVNGLKTIQESEAKRFEEANKSLTDRLNTLGEKLLKERSESLQAANKENMLQIVNPLQKELSTFRELINSTQKSSSEQAGQLKNELKNLQQAQLTLEQQATNLSNALMQGSKTQGMWGEHQLELVLEAAGLRRNDGYVRELASTNEAGERGRVDVLIQLPQNQGIIIDSKCSLTAYTNYMTAENEGDTKAIETAFKEHVDSVRKHIKELSVKNYPSYSEYGSPSFVFMFVPIDHALSIVLRKNPSLYDEAQKNNVYLVSPSSLLPALRIVANLWSLAHQGDRFTAIASKADKIFAKCVKICGDFENIKKHRDNLSKSIDAVNTSLCDGKGNLRRLLENFSKDAPVFTKQVISSFEAEADYGLVDDGTNQIPYSVKPLKQLAAVNYTSTEDMNMATDDANILEAQSSAPDLPLNAAIEAAADAADIQADASADADASAEAADVPADAAEDEAKL